MPDMKKQIRKLLKINLLNVGLTGMRMNRGAYVTSTFTKSIQGLIEGKPFAGYSNFDDCVRKNSDKGDPKAYCAEIMRQVEGGKSMEGNHTVQKLLESDTMAEKTNEAKTDSPEKVEAKDFTGDISEIKESLKSLSERLEKLESKEEEPDEGDGEPEESEEQKRIGKLETETKELRKLLEKPETKATGPLNPNKHDETEPDDSGESKSIIQNIA